MRVEFIKDTPTKHNPNKVYKKGVIYVMDYKLGKEYIKDEKAKRVDKEENFFKKLTKQKLDLNKKKVE